ncbi:DUF3131 domain-containing protein [Nostoc sphaeroides]|uniref:DUF3131 domain-containing protein n=1 Tax=Nostoc sphaeroides CCNUC1 TaxID=2653204 RepID=A0A5P8WCJ0_9NOSO|nr:DUF3131 domain-containing protein [Nostoc sphaeroides]QFS50525.1 hypothetical protein GXM_08019 [Nostoc sphaeroides CCNUC1]
MTKDIILNPASAQPSLLKQAIIASAIALIGFGFNQALQWRETSILPTPVTSQGLNRLSVEDIQLAHTAWRYFEKNRLSTGLVSSAADFPATTMWDVGSQFAGMVAARELELLSAAEFDQWMQSALATLAKLPLYRNELPNKAYNAKTLIPVNYGQLQKPQEIGFSALDLARLVQWLDIIATRYPQHAAASRAVTARWKLERLVQNGQLMGAEYRSGKETWNQEGRLGYEQYAAYSLKKIGVIAAKALDTKAENKFVNIMGVEVPSDKRTTYHNYVTSEPYILDGLESGFKALPAEYAAKLLQAQQRRYQATNQLTAWSEDNLDREPWFVYNCIFVNGELWKSIDSSGKDAAAFRGSSIKAAIGWHMLFQTRYTEKLYKGMRWLADPNRGVFAGFYEQTQEPNRALTVNTNGIVLEALLYRRVGKPLAVWANEPH